MQYSLTASNQDGFSLTLNGVDLPSLVQAAENVVAVYLGRPLLAPGAGVVVAAKPGGRKKQPHIIVTAPATAPAQTDIEDLTTTAAALQAVPDATYDDAVSSLQKLNSKHGMQAVRLLLDEFDYKKVGDMKPDKYAAIIKKADEQTAA